MNAETWKKIEEYKQTDQYKKTRAEFTPCKWNSELKEDPGCNSKNKNMLVMECSGHCK